MKYYLSNFLNKIRMHLIYVIPNKVDSIENIFYFILYNIIIKNILVFIFKK